MGANIAGIYGAQIFRSDDKPFYRRGFSIAIAVLAAGLLLAIVRYIDDRIRRKRTAGQVERVESTEGQDVDGELVAGGEKSVLADGGVHGQQKFVVDDELRAAVGGGKGRG